MADLESSFQEELAGIIAEIDRLEESGEPTNSKPIQESVRRGIEILEKLTRWVSQMAMFSENEQASELPAGFLRFLLLPALLGYLNGKIVDENRLDVLQREKVYYRDFLRRLESYDFIPRTEEIGDGDSSSEKRKLDSAAVTRNRQAKIERFKEKQSLETKLDALRQRLIKGVAIDDETQRELYSTELKLWAARIADSIQTVEQELEMLRMRDRAKGDPIPSGSAAGPSERPQPLKPFIITRTAMQKAVYGMGYPSLPTFTLEEFFEQKFGEGQIQVHGGPGEEKRNGPITEEEEQIMREDQEDREMSEVVQHDREYDEYKDDHRRGSGNTHNKG